MPIPGKWIMLMTACTAMLAMTYLELDPRRAMWHGVRIFFKLYIVGSILQLVVTWVYKKFMKNRQIQEQTDSDSNVEEENRERLIQSREELQADHREKASSFKDKIMIPREEAKRKKKEEEFLQFCGPAWKGHGDKLGGEDDRDPNGSDEQAGKEARNIRKLPDSVQLHIPRTEPKTTKRVINLPDEPNSDTADVITIILRTPLGTNHKRRFLTSCTVQVVFDYMTTLGFKEKLFTLATSYPRQLLTDCVDRTIYDLGFYKQIILNIEEL